MSLFIIAGTKLHAGLEFLPWSYPENNHVIWVVYLKQVWKQTIINLIRFVIDTGSWKYFSAHFLLFVK